MKIAARFHKTIGIVANDKPEAQKARRKLMSVIENDYEGFEVRTYVGSGGYIPYTTDEIIKSDILFVLGGDGTVLEWARKIVSQGANPLMVTVNFGTLGFITEVEVKQMAEALKCINDGRYTTSERLMLKCRIIHRDNPASIAEFYALNDIAVVKSRHARMLILNTSINGKEIAQQHSDGIIVSTPTGSTGYNLSAGGAILHPDLQVMQVTPICPHTLHSRPIVIPATDAVIKIEVVPRADRNVEAQVVVDGQECAFFNDNEYRIEIERNERNVTIVSLGEDSFYDKLCNRLQWGKGIV